MDGWRFDTLTRALSAVPTRRGILQALVAALAADALGLVRVKAANCPGLGVSNSCSSDGDCAGCDNAVCQFTMCLRPTGGKCRRNSQCASGSCNRKKRKCRGCAAGETICGGRCDLGCGANATSPVNCLCCYVDTCATNNPPTVCCSGSCVGGHCTGCTPQGDQCTSNRECCTNVCVGGKCDCTATGRGCVRHVQCCSRHCGADGRCAAPCGNGEPPCNDVCCPNNATCVADHCLCADNQPPCGGTQCCASGETCGPAGCVGGPGS